MIQIEIWEIDAWLPTLAFERWSRRSQRQQRERVEAEDEDAVESPCKRWELPRQVLRIESSVPARRPALLRRAYSALRTMRDYLPARIRILIKLNSFPMRNERGDYPRFKLS